MTGDDRNRASRSEWGEGDERGALNRVTPSSRAAIVARADATQLYDLSVDFFIGMPSFVGAGDPQYQIWMTHTPRGSVIDDANGLGRAVNEYASYSGDSILFYTHAGTHIDALNHFGYHGEVYNGFTADEHLGSRHWERLGADRIDPIVARGVLIDVATAHGVETLPPSYGITIDDCRQALERTGTELEAGDVVLVRTGQMRLWPDPRYLEDFPGITLETAEWLAGQRVVAVGADNGSVERIPSGDGRNWLPAHCHLLAEAGIPLMEQLFLEELARDEVFEVCFIGAPIRFRGATGSPLRPIAFPLREST
jgi:kynurenine formamidase